MLSLRSAGGGGAADYPDPIFTFCIHTSKSPATSVCTITTVSIKNTIYSTNYFTDMVIETIKVT